MDFDFTQEQAALRDSARDYLSQKCTTQFVRTMFEDPTGFSKPMWKEMAGLGWLGLTFPEENDGLGLGMVELALMLEEMGRAVFPGPYFASVLLAGGAIKAAGDKSQKQKYLGGIASGDVIATMGMLEDAPNWDAEGIALNAQAGGGGFVLNGMKRFVPFAQAADVMLIPARTSKNADPGKGISLFLVEAKGKGVESSPMKNIDLTNKASEVRFNNVMVPEENVVGEIDNGWHVVQKVLQQAAVGASAEMLGAARKSMEMSVEYAKMREAFGQKLGQFQAIKHKLADMLVDVESSHSAVYYAAWAQDAQSADAALAASVAKAYVGDAARKVCGEAIQVHGGIGFTWDFDLHLWFKRAKFYEPMFGDAEYHRELAARALAG
ncbi:MAG: acyl-CoA/acyl-ACP dehydrogenase [Chloroflexi bacterium]|nr:acyl-CoA/acyl-ACP dehydrogenase [Chloroflexota bacterium]